MYIYINNLWLLRQTSPPTHARCRDGGKAESKELREFAVESTVGVSIELRKLCFNIPNIATVSDTSIISQHDIGSNLDVFIRICVVAGLSLSCL